MGTKVYRFGLLPPVEGDSVIRQQMRLAHRYRNDLVAIERGRRAAVREAQRTAGTELAEAETVATELDALCADLTGQIKAARAATRSKSETDPMRYALAAAKASRIEAMTRVRDLRRALRSDPKLIAELERIDELAKSLHRDARAICGVYWGTYGLIEQAMQASRSAPLYDGLEPNDPRFVRWEGEGQVAIQIQQQTGDPPFLAPQLYMGRDTRIRIDPVATWCKRNRHGEERRKLPLLRMRVDSLSPREPVWGVWPIIMHRSIPVDAVIRRASVSLRLRGPREEWSVEITVNEPNVEVEPRGHGAVALNFGWRVVPGGIRVATTVDDTGHVEHLELPQRISGGLQKVADLESIRDKSFNEARARLVAWLIVNGSSAPQWLKDETKTIGQWRSLDRLIRLAQRWKRDRFVGDTDGFRELEAWRYNDHHLWRWQEDQRINSIRARREIYRCFAARLCERYATIYVDNFDLRTVAEKRPLEAEPQTEYAGARANRQLAAVSILRGAIDNAAPSRGAFVVEVETGHDTRTCADCGHEENWDAAKSINHICPACGVVWDQDVNAARNVMRRGEQLGDVAQLRAARALESLEKKSRWAKVRERVAEKKRGRSQTDP